MTIAPPLISVIVPFLNMEAWLGRCLASLQAQTYPRLEILLVDDGSTDGSSALARQAAAQDDRLRCLAQPHGGLAAARNTGLDSARGELIAFVDADDWVEPDFISRLYAALQDGEADIACCSAVRVWASGRVQTYRPATLPDRVFTDAGDYLSRYGELACNKLFRRELFQGLRFPVGLPYEDYALIPQVCARAHRIACLSAPLYSYFWREDSIINAGVSPEDYLRAHAVLESSDFARLYPEILELYLAKNLLGNHLYLLCARGRGREAKALWERCRSRCPHVARWPLSRFVQLLNRTGGGFAYLMSRRLYALAAVYPGLVSRLKKLR